MLEFQPYKDYSFNSINVFLLLRKPFIFPISSDIWQIRKTSNFFPLQIDYRTRVCMAYLELKRFTFVDVVMLF